MDVDGPCAAPQGTLIQEQTSPRPFNLGFRVPIHMAKKPLENPLEKPLKIQIYLYDMSKLPIFGVFPV